MDQSGDPRDQMSTQVLREMTEGNRRLDVIREYLEKSELISYRPSLEFVTENIDILQQRLLCATYRPPRGQLDPHTRRYIPDSSKPDRYYTENEWKTQLRRGKEHGRQREPRLLGVEHSEANRRERDTLSWRGFNGSNRSRGRYQEDNTNRNRYRGQRDGYRNDQPKRHRRY